MRHRSTFLALITLTLGLAAPTGARAADVVSLSITPTSLPASGGLVALGVHVAFTPSPSCTLTSSLSTTTWACTAHPVVNVAANATTVAETIPIDVTVTDGTLTSRASASLVVAAAAPGAYVALGDSYASGEGNPGAGWVDRTGNAAANVNATDGCDRSASAYPVLVARWLSVRATSAPLSFLACSGATTTDLAATSPAASAGLAGATGDHGEGPQLDDAAELGGAQLVTLTIGGNDLFFAQVLGTCVTVPGWCSANSPVPAVRDLRANTTRLAGVLDATYQLVRSLAPHARLVVVAYPRLVPVPRALTREDLSHGCAGLRGGALLYLARAETSLNNVIARAARANGLTLADPNAGVDSFASGGGHSLCDATPWFNSLDLRHPRYSLHPNAAGQRALARAVEAALAP